MAKPRRGHAHVSTGGFKGSITTAHANLGAKNSRRVDCKVVACPQCGAAVGDACTTDGRTTNTHRPRKRMAIRAENKRRLLNDSE